MRPEVVCSGRDHHEVVADALAGLADTRCFDRGGVLSRHLTTAQLVPHTLETLRVELARARSWVKQTKDGQAFVVEPPTPVVRACLEWQDYGPLGVPAVDRVVQTPVLDANGRVDLEPGYQASARVLYQPSGRLREGLAGHPWRPALEGRELLYPWQVEEAKATLLGQLLGDFPFVHAADRAHALALLLLPFMRELIQGPTPLTVVEAPVEGTGKSLLVEAVLRVALGATPAATVLPGDAEEMRKSLTAALLGAPAAVWLDNVAGEVRSAQLAQVLTVPVWEDRVLGASRRAALPVRNVWVLTANNARFSAELARRSVRVRLDAGLAEPWRRRSFAVPNLLGWVEEEELALVTSCLTLCRWWVQNGREAGAHGLGSYDEWAQVMGGVLEVAEVDGFLAGEAAITRSAPEVDELEQVVAAWVEAVPDGRKVTASELAQLLGQAQALPYVVAKQPYAAQPTMLGRWLGEYRDRPVLGWVLRAKKAHNSTTWYLDPSQGDRS